MPVGIQYCVFDHGVVAVCRFDCRLSRQYLALRVEILGRAVYGHRIKSHDAQLSRCFHQPTHGVNDSRFVYG